jgi:multidrug transporter EmrE-like cation transporter
VEIGETGSKQTRVISICNGKFNYHSVVLMMTRSMFLMTTQMMYIVASYYCLQAGINYALIVNIFGFAPFLTAFFFYFVYKEGLTYLHFMGMTLMTTCVILLNVASSSSSDEDEDGEEYISVMYPIAAGIFLAFLFAI